MIVRRNGLRNLYRLLFYALCSMLIILGGCASLPQKKNILAVVNGEPITEDDLKYSLQIAHRKEDLSSAGELNLSKFVQKLVDDRLIIQEARRMGMENYPEVEKLLQEELRAVRPRHYRGGIRRKGSGDNRAIGERRRFWRTCP
jgi:hypothetical protein